MTLAQAMNPASAAKSLINIQNRISIVANGIDHGPIADRKNESVHQNDLVAVAAVVMIRAATHASHVNMAVEIALRLVIELADRVIAATNAKNIQKKKAEAIDDHDLVRVKNVADNKIPILEIVSLCLSFLSRFECLLF